MPSTARLSPTDQALVEAVAAWAGVEALPLLRRFGVRRARRLAAALAPEPPADPLGSLREAARAQFVPDPDRVHPSWYLRALQDESPAARRHVIGASAEPLRSAMILGLGLDPLDLGPDGPVDPEAREVAVTLWTERLVGDLPRRADDPPVILALSGLPPVALYRLARVCGLAKGSLLEGGAIEPGRPLTTERLAWFRSRLPQPSDARLLRIAANDWSSAESVGRHRLAGFGLVTLGRLLSRADAHRVRWALQHVPYPIAKRLRVAATRPQASVRQVLALEEMILEAAQDRLREEGRATAEGFPHRGRSS